MRRRRQIENSNRGNKGGGARCSSRKLHWRVLQEKLNLLVERHHRRNTGELHAYGWRRAYSLPPSLGHHRQPGIDSLNSLAGLAAWRRQQRQLEAAGVPAAEAMQPEAAEEAGQGGKVEAAGACRGGGGGESA